ncbi:uncharacterized protein G2W53_044172 [Senna tora]|uniref:Uncharacterized protein n=1 Tax=Senna tora TaxID=362788 RepID=A0A834SKH0_9FABA|nr:uncharacterized protein G2W53_044172 [Senna tora]
MAEEERKTHWEEGMRRPLW